MVKVAFTGMGMDTTPPMEALSSPLVITYSPVDKAFDLALLQGGVFASIVDQGLALKWNTIYGYFQMGSKDKRPGLRKGEGGWERNAFAYAAQVYNECLEALRNVDTQLAKLDGDVAVDVRLDEVSSQKDKILNALEINYFKTGVIRESAGHYRWIGLETTGSENARNVTTPLIIPRVIEGKKDIVLNASVLPTVPDTEKVLTPYDDNFQSCVVSGMIHAFEEQETWQPRSSIRAAMLQYVLSGKWSTETLLAAASRAGLFPRLGSKDTGNTYFWRKLIALGLTAEYFQKNYLKEWTRPVGQVRYIFAGSGVPTILENILLRYAKGGMVAVSENETSNTDGLFFFPSSNSYGSQYQFGFVEAARSEKDSMVIEPADGPRIYAKWDPEVLVVEKDGILNVTEQQQAAWNFHPIAVEPSHSTRLQWEFLGAGLKKRTMVVRDRLDPSPGYMPSDMIKCMTIGWPPAYTPQGLILRGNAAPTRLDEFSTFEVEFARRPADEIKT